jgi:hypothetical protein
MAARAAMLLIGNDLSKTVAQEAGATEEGEMAMATRKQRRAAKKNIKKAAKATKRKRTLKHLPKKTLRALGKQAAKVRQS